MFFRYHDLTIELQSPDEAVRQLWAQLFAGWLDNKPPREPDLRLELSWRAGLPPLPAAPPLFTDENTRTAVPAILTVYPGLEGTVHLHFHQAGLVTVPLTAVSGGQPPTAQGVVIPACKDNGRFEDVTFTSLAPLLRRYGCFLLHAFAAVKDGQAILLVGASGSGKTTTGLRLLLDGWRLLSNDVVRLETRADGVYALATPDMVSIRPFTFQILPQLQQQLNLAALPRQPVSVNAHTLTNGRWAAPARVTAVYFPHITGQPASAITPLSRAVCLARLMEESVDRWDTAVFPQHLALLQTLSQQAGAHTLHLGADLDKVPSLLQ